MKRNRTENLKTKKKNEINVCNKEFKLSNE
jgi:hypothetical protein